MGNQLPVPRMENTFDVSTTSLLDLPLETTLDISSYLDKNDIKALRSTCRRMDTLLLDTFGNQFFNSLYIMPTTLALDALIQISEDQRIRQHVKELHICCSMYQDCERELNTYNSPRWLQDNELPFENVSTPEQEATNNSVTLVRKSGFEAQLIIALRNLNITHMTIYDYRRLREAPSALELGRSQLLQQTGRDPRDARGRAWEYTTGPRDPDSGPMDMATCMTTAIFRAIEETLPPISTLNLPNIQLDKLNVSETLGPKLIHLTHLTLTLSLSHRITPDFSPTTPKILSSINSLPNLQHLHLSTYPHKRLITSSLSLYPYLLFLHPSPTLTSLHLSSLSDTDPCLATFLSHLPSLTTLSLHFTPISQSSNPPWLAMFNPLTPILCNPSLSTLTLVFDGRNAWEFAARYIRTGTTGFDCDSESEDEETRYQPSRREMLNALKEILPNYTRHVFRRCCHGQTSRVRG